MKRRDFLLGTAGISLALPFSGLITPAFAQDAVAEKPDLTLAVGGKPLLYYLPLTIAERQGFFEEQGLNVTINDFAGGSKSLQALIGGSVDMVCGAYEHTIRMQDRGQDITAICALGRFPGIVVAVRKDLEGEIKSVADLKGRKMGVTAPGSSTALFLDYLLQKNGLQAADVSMIGIGGGASAVASIKRGEIDGLVHLDPVIGQLQYDDDISILIDTRTQAGTKEVFGGPNPAAIVYSFGSFAQENPITTQKAVNAFMKALKWIGEATPDQVADAVPEEYLLGNRDLYKQAFQNSTEMFAPDGMISQEGYASMVEMLKTIDPELADVDVPYEKTFNETFVKAAQI